MSEKFKFRRGNYGENTPDTEYIDAGEPIHDATIGALGIGAGERNPRFYPAINEEGNLRLLPGQEIVSFHDKTTSLRFENGFFIVKIKGVDILKVNESANALFEALSIAKITGFNELVSDGYPNAAGLSFKDGILRINCPVEFLSSLNLSLSEFAEGIIPTNFNENDIFVAGSSAGGSAHSWKNPSVLATNLSKLAPLIYRATNRGKNRTLDLSFEDEIYFGANNDGRGAFDDNLVSFLNTFNSAFVRDSVGYYFNSLGVLTRANAYSPRIDYDPFSGRCLGILIESTTQNLYANSNSIENFVPVNMGALPINRANWTALGFRNPRALSEQGSGEHYVKWTFPNRDLSKAYASSVLVELPSETAIVRLQLLVTDNTNFFSAKFNLSSDGGVITGSNKGGFGNVIGSPFVRRISPTIYRIGVAGIVSNSSSLGNIEVRIQGLDAANNVSYASSAGGIAYVGEAQFEPNNRVSSLIPTFGSPVTRFADQLQLSFDRSFSYKGLKNKLGINFLSPAYVEGDPVFALFNSDYSSTLRVGPNSTLIFEKGPNGNTNTTVINDIDTDANDELNDQVSYEFDCSDNPENSILYIGANKENSRSFNGWFNLAYLSR